MMISALKSLSLCYGSSYSCFLFLIYIFQFMVPNLHNAQYIAFSWISLTLVQDFSFVCPLLLISNLSYKSNRIKLCYNEIRFQPIKYLTLLKFLHNTSSSAYETFLNSNYLCSVMVSIIRYTYIIQNFL